MHLEGTSSLIISSAVSGASGALVTLLATKGVDWLIELVANHSPAVQKKARQNMENFLYRLADRVERLEHELPLEERSIINESMENPGTAFLISNTMKYSAITDNDEHHALLSELIAQRLGAGANDMVTLVGTAACEVVNSLTVRQIHLLAVLVVLLDVRPLEIAPLEGIPNPNEYLCVWWEKNLQPLLELFDIRAVTHLDLDHLVAMRCLRISIFAKDLNEILSDRIFSSKIHLDKAIAEQYSFYKILLSGWRLIGLVDLTSIGKLIGVLHRDSTIKSKTSIAW